MPDPLVGRHSTRQITNRIARTSQFPTQLGGQVVPSLTNHHFPQVQRLHLLENMQEVGFVDQSALVVVVDRHHKWIRSGAERGKAAELALDILVSGLSGVEQDAVYPGVGHPLAPCCLSRSTVNRGNCVRNTSYTPCSPPNSVSRPVR